jgi:hypothetical protein
MKRTRQVLVMTLMATALCADRVVTTAPELRESLASASADPLARLASNLGSRFSGSFRRVSTPVVRLHQDRRDATATPVAAPQPIIATVATPHVAEGSPFQFRLPPPAC